MILIKEEIRRRVENLEARRNDLLESLKGPALLPSEMCKQTDRIAQLNFAIYEFNSLLENHAPAQGTPVHPSKSVQEMSPEETDSYFDGIITGILDFSEKQGTYSQATYDFIKKQFQYFVNVASAQWCEGWIDKLEELERAFNEAKLGFMQGEKMLVSEAADKVACKPTSKPATLNPMTAPIQPGCVFYDYVGERFEVVSIEYYKS